MIVLCFDNLTIRGNILIHKKAAVLLLLFSAFFFSSGLWAQESDATEQQFSYSKGDQNFILNAGLFLPLFYLSTDGTSEPALETTRPGITGTLSWISFVNNTTAVGFEFGGSYTQTLNRTCVMIPILGKIGYTFISYPFEIPLSFGAGVNFLKVGDLFTTSAIVKPEAGFYWNWSSEWAFGANVSYWFVPEVYFSGTLQDQSRFGNFLDIRLSVMYHF